MSYNDMKTDFKNILNRADCSDSLADTFMRQGMSRVQRVCRIPSMERAQLITPTDQPMAFMPVPPDLIQIRDIIAPRIGDSEGRMTTLRKRSYGSLMEISTLAFPDFYARQQTLIYFRGLIPVGQQLQFLYYGNFSPFATADSENELSASTPDLAVYAALSYAGDHFEHPSTMLWENRFQSIKTEVEQMGMDLENEGGPAVVEPIYFEDD